jgi:hypothetical protein
VLLKLRQAVNKQNLRPRRQQQQEQGQLLRLLPVQAACLASL